MNKLVKVAGLVTAFVIAEQSSFAQQEKSIKTGDVPKGWHLLDNTKDGYAGISINKAYDFVHLKHLKGKTVIVAIIDSGIDTLHEDLKDILWVNPKEIPGNGIDDDGNGYVDDIHGWNFIGGKDGRNVKQDSYEGARVYHMYKAKFSGQQVDTTKMSAQEKDQYKMWLKAKAKVEGDGNEEPIDMNRLRKFLSIAQKSDSILRAGMGKDTYTGNELDTFKTGTPQQDTAKNALMFLFKNNQMMETTNKEFLDGFEEFVSGEERKEEAKSKAPEDYRGEITHDNEQDINDHNYGNADVMASTPFHGTHVAGIIGAERNNGKGMDGVADNVRIMMIRAVPDGDEHDKDIALAIRYAADNGARVVNMSFGKDFSPQKKWIDSAVRYAESKGVLLVHAAGNDAKNIDTADNFPNAIMKDTHKKASNWITVGASGDPNAGGYTASFSNYGKKQVDVFAPGVKIWSSIPGGNTYGMAQGTSMACPVVAGTAAFLLEYFPKLTPQQLRYCIMKSAVAPGVKVNKPGTDETVYLSDISQSGGIINAYEAAKVAATLKQGSKVVPAFVPAPKKPSPKPTLKNKKG